MTTATKTGVTMSILSVDGEWYECGDFSDACDAILAASAAQVLSGKSAKYAIHTHHWTYSDEPDKVIVVDGNGNYTNV